MIDSKFVDVDMNVHFPKLMVHRYSNFVILATGLSPMSKNHICGYVIKTTDYNAHALFKYSDQWIAENFITFDGTITWKNKNELVDTY